jgi:hypothetical protein
MASHQSLEQESQPALSIVLERLDMTPDGHFRPGAFIKLTKAFRTSGLLAALAPEELKSFFTLLSFLTPNGDCSPTLMQLASAMRVSQSKARSRMQRLTQVRFEQEPLVLAITHGNGQEAYALKSKFIPVIEQPPIGQQKPAPLKATPREQVIEYSRRRYARTREEVEREIAQLNGWELPEESQVSNQQGVDPQGTPLQEPNEEAESSQQRKAPLPANEQPYFKDLRRRLQNAGVAPDQIEYLLTHFETERIEKQLNWLPFRHARNPSAYLAAAIIGDYEEPIYRR